MPDVIKAKTWREMAADDILKSVEVAISVVKEQLEGEALDEPSTMGRVLQLLDLSAVFQEMAFKIVQGQAESYAHM